MVMSLRPISTPHSPGPGIGPRTKNGVDVHIATEKQALDQPEEIGVFLSKFEEELFHNH